MRRALVACLFELIKAENKCGLNTNVQYQNCKDGENNKFNKGKVKTKKDFELFVDGIPDGVACARVQCTDKYWDEWGQKPKLVKKSATKAGCVNGRWMKMKKKKGRFEPTDIPFEYPDCPVGCTALPNHVLADLTSKVAKDVDGQVHYPSAKSAKAKCRCKANPNDASQLWTTRSDVCKNQAIKCDCYESGCTWNKSVECGEITEWSEWSDCSPATRQSTRECKAMSTSHEVTVDAENCGLTSNELSRSEGCAQLTEWSSWSICHQAEHSRTRQCKSGDLALELSACDATEEDATETEFCSSPLEWKRKMWITMSSARGRDNTNGIRGPYDMSWVQDKYGKPFEKCCSSPRAAFDGLHSGNCATLGGNDKNGIPYFNAATGECDSNVKTYSLAGSYIHIYIGQPYNISRVDVAVNPLYPDAYAALQLYVTDEEYADTGREAHLSTGVSCGLSDDLSATGQPTKPIISYTCTGSAVGQFAWLSNGNSEDNSDMITLEEVWVYADLPVFSSFWAEWNFPEPCKGSDGGHCSDHSYGGTVIRHRQCNPPSALGSDMCPEGGQSEGTGMVTCQHRCRELGYWEFTPCSATCGGTQRRVRSCSNTGHGLPGKDYCANDDSIVDETVYSCGTRCWDEWDATSTLDPANDDPNFSQMDCGTEGDDYTVEADGKWKVRFGVVCTFQCVDGYRPATSKASVMSGVTRTLLIDESDSSFAWEYMNTATSSSAAVFGTDQDPFGSDALGTKCFKISGVHPSRMSCPDRDVSNSKFGITGAECTDGNNPGSVCTHTCAQDWKPVDLRAMTSICHCEAKCLWLNTFSQSGKDWSKSGQIKCRATDCGRPTNTNLAWYDGKWGSSYNEHQFQCFRDDAGTKVYDNSVPLETATGPNDLSESATWPMGSYCREINCPEGKKVSHQPACECQYSEGTMFNNELIKHKNMKCKWSAKHDDIESYCRWPPREFDDRESCFPLAEGDIDNGGVKNWDKEHGIFCSNDPFEDGNYPLDSVCWYKCLPGFVHEEASITHRGVPGQCHYATYNDMFYNTWMGMGNNDNHWFPDCVRIQVGN